jgi:hypothetical protein
MTWYSVGTGYAVLWYCSWGYTARLARLGEPPRRRQVVERIGRKLM